MKKTEHIKIVNRIHEKHKAEINSLKNRQEGELKNVIALLTEELKFWKAEATKDNRSIHNA